MTARGWRRESGSGATLVTAFLTGQDWEFEVSYHPAVSESV